MRKATDGYTVLLPTGNEIKENFMHLDKLWLIKYFNLSSTLSGLAESVV